MPENAPTPEPEQNEFVVAEPRRSTWSEMKTSEDWWAVWIGGALLLICFLAFYLNLPENFSEQLTEAQAAGEKLEVHSPLKSWLAKPGKWNESPRDSLFPPEKSSLLIPICVVFLISLCVFAIGIKVMGQSVLKFAIGFLGVFLLATLAYVLTGQVVAKRYNLEYALWALMIGLVISNTIGTPKWMKPALKTELYIKTGLVIMGASVLFSRLLILGVPGICVAWIVTPIVLISTYIFGQKILKLESKSLNMVISADMSVCGVSAAIATAASCKAKKEELSFAIGLSLSFTVFMMILMPIVIKLLGIGPILGGAWMGGTIDSTGAVAASGAILGEQAEQIAITIKMIQNILIGVTAFGVAVYWVTCVEGKDSQVKPNAWEIWYRFPKFVLGFVLASSVFSLLYVSMQGGEIIVPTMVKESSKVFRGWFFCLAFISIGLETNFRELTKFLKGGKPLILYVCGQSLNLILTLLMAWLMFSVFYKDVINEVFNK
ncbi:MAG: putative sulfate exporter family transporter [Planctomycetes bacterium]|nr:putative sulfate exporter family transporter [Planctomycetota bacterium]MCH9724407.1 putative sulfate exporter family transporter [Planctomycetota bacterium]MCH9776228.1 putative sulfate exporter family transporter [Planctomycetota bacterium]MCH9793226.1 putative sulfate exporter family transporter [Planctomycetota bacterium]